MPASHAPVRSLPGFVHLRARQRRGTARRYQGGAWVLRSARRALPGEAGRAGGGHYVPGHPEYVGQGACWHGFGRSRRFNRHASEAARAGEDGLAETEDAVDVSGVRGGGSSGRPGARRVDAARRSARPGSGASGGRPALPAAYAGGAAAASRICRAASAAAARMVGASRPAVGIHSEVGSQLPVGDADGRGKGRCCRWGAGSDGGAGEAAG